MALSVATSLTADVTQDGVEDLVALVGERIPGSQYWQNLRLVIQNGASSVIGAIDLPNPEAVSPSLAVVPLTRPDAQNIIVTLPTGGSGGIINYNIFAYEDAIIQTIFTSDEYNAQYEYEVNYADNYKVVVASLANRQSYDVDLSRRDEEYLSPLYLPNGTLRRPTEGFVNPLSGLYPVDFNGDGVYSLLAYQETAGLSNADTLGYILNTLEWFGNQFILTEQLFGLTGTPFTPIQPR